MFWKNIFLMKVFSGLFLLFLFTIILEGRRVIFIMCGIFFCCSVIFSGPFWLLYGKSSVVSIFFVSWFLPGLNLIVFLKVSPSKVEVGLHEAYTQWTQTKFWFWGYVQYYMVVILLHSIWWSIQDPAMYQVFSGITSIGKHLLRYYEMFGSYSVWPFNKCEVPKRQTSVTATKGGTWSGRNTKLNYVVTTYFIMAIIH